MTVLPKQQSEKVAVQKRLRLGPVSVVALALGLACTGSALAANVEGDPRADVVVALDSVKTSWEEAQPSIVIEGDRRDVRVGDSARLLLQSAKVGWGFLVFVDGYGQIEVVKKEIGRDNLVTSNALPVSVQQGPPVGANRVYLFLTQSALDFDQLAAVDGLLIADGAKAREFARDLAAALGRGPVAVASFDYVVRGRDDAVEYAAADVTAFFTQRAVGVRILPVHINFGFNSADLTPAAKQQLATVAEGFSSSALTTRRFLIAGHTDDVGSDDYNLQLSERRAASVRAFLVEAGVGPERLTTRGYGESKPYKTGTTEDARAANRRVEFSDVVSKAE